MVNEVCPHFFLYLIVLQNFWFRKGRSCLYQVLQYFNQTLRNFLSNSDTNSIYLDFSKAFDKVNHKLLVKKVWAYGIQSKVYSWAVSFLPERTQLVAVNGIYSFLSVVLNRVPQGTVIGPILFLMYINDLEKCVSHSAALLMIQCYSEQSPALTILTFSNEIFSVFLFGRNVMVLHEKKFELLCHLSNKLPLIISELYNYITSNGVVISPSTSVKNIRVIISSDLSWWCSMVATATKMSAWVLSLFQDRSKDTMVTLSL